MHTVTAVVQKSPSNIPLKLIDGQLVLDRGWAPYSQVPLTVKTPTNTTELAYIDPRDDRRVTITVTRTDNGVTHSTRTFDLALVDVKHNYGSQAGTMTLELATDETLLQDYSVLTTERIYGLDVRTAVLYALAKIGRDAYLITEPTLTNLATNPSVETSTTLWTAIAGTGGVASRSAVTTATDYGAKVLRTTWSTATTGAGGGTYYDQPVTAGLTYSFGFSHVKSSIANRLIFRIEWLAAGLSIISTVLGSEVQVAAGTVYGAADFAIQGIVAPPTAAYARLKVISVAGTGFANWSVTSYLQLDALMVNLGATVNTYFDGETTDTSTHTYAWTGTANASTSTDVPVQNGTLTTQDYGPALTNLTPNPLRWASTLVTTGWAPSASGGAGGVAAVTNAATPVWGGTFGFTQKILRCTWSTATVAAGSGIYHDLPVTAGKRYSIGMFYIRTSIATRLSIGIEWRTASTAISTTWSTDELQTLAEPLVGPSDNFNLNTDGPSGAKLWLENQAAPATATVARIFIRTVTGTGFANWTVGSTLDVLNFMAIEGSSLDPAFNGVGRFGGATPEPWSGIYTYAWTGTADQSTSTRTPQPNNDAMIWKAGVSAWDWISEIVRAVGLQLWCDETRNWHLLALDYPLPASSPTSAALTVAEGINMIEGDDRISRRSDSEWGTGVVVHSQWIDSEGATQESWGYAGTSNRVITVESTIPNDQSASSILAKITAQGRTYSADLISDYSATPGQPLTITVPNESASTQRLGTVTWSIGRNKLMGISTARGKTRTPSPTPTAPRISATNLARRIRDKFSLNIER